MKNNFNRKNKNAIFNENLFDISVDPLEDSVEEKIQPVAHSTKFFKERSGHSSSAKSSMEGPRCPCITCLPKLQKDLSISKDRVDGSQYRRGSREKSSRNESLDFSNRYKAKDPKDVLCECLTSSRQRKELSKKKDTPLSSPRKNYQSSKNVSPSFCTTNYSAQPEDHYPNQSPKFCSSSWSNRDKLNLFQKKSDKFRKKDYTKVDKSYLTKGSQTKLDVCCYCDKKEFVKDRSPGELYHSVNNGESKKRLINHMNRSESGNKGSECPRYFESPESTDNYDPVNCSAGYSTPPNVNNTFSYTNLDAREKKSSRSIRRDKESQERSRKDVRYQQVLQDLKKDYGKVNGNEKYSYGFDLEDIRPDVPSIEDWKQCGKRWKDMSDEYKKLTRVLKLNQKHAEMKTDQSRDGVRKRITRTYPSGKEFSFEVKIPGKNLQKDTDVWKFEMKNMGDSNCDYKNASPSSSPLYPKESFYDNAEPCTCSRQNSGNGAKRKKEFIKKPRNISKCCPCEETSKETTDKFKSSRNQIYRSNSFDAFTTINTSEPELYKARNEQDCQCENEDSVEKLWQCPKSSKSWRNRVCSPNPTNVRIMRPSKNSKNLKTILIYPPRSEGGPPLKLYKNLSKIHCKVHGDMYKGFRYNVTYVQKFVSPILHPCEKKYDSGCSSDYG